MSIVIIGIKKIYLCAKHSYYAYPENYCHIAGKEERRVNVTFDEKDMKLYDELVEQAEANGITYEEEAKRMIAYYQKVRRMRGDIK